MHLRDENVHGSLQNLHVPKGLQGYVQGDGMGDVAL
jgi:hypothetical protein